MRRVLAGAMLALACAQMLAQGADSIATVRTLMTEQRYAAAETAARMYLKEHDGEARAHFLLGTILFREQKARESLAEFTAGARYERPGPEELKTVAADYVLLDDMGDAEKWLTEVVLARPDDADAWYLLGRTKFNENDFEHARTSLERSLALRPRHVEAENNIGLCWKELGEPEKARAAFETAIEWQGKDVTDAQPFLNLGRLLAEQGETQRAASFLERAAALAPENPLVHEELAAVYGKQQNLARAQSELERAVELAPEISGLHFKLGQLYRKLGQTKRAQREFAICAQLNSTHSSTETPNRYTPR